MEGERKKKRTKWAKGGFKLEKQEPNKRTARRVQPSAVELHIHLRKLSLPNSLTRIGGTNLFFFSRKLRDDVEGAEPARSIGPWGEIWLDEGCWTPQGSAVEPG